VVQGRGGGGKKKKKNKAQTPLHGHTSEDKIKLGRESGAGLHHFWGIGQVGEGGTGAGWGGGGGWGVVVRCFQ